jgi:putative ABC transport system permease protein
LLADSVLLALAGGALGVALAPAAMQALIAFLPRDTAGHALHATIDARLLLFAFLVSMAAGVLSGVAPALHGGGPSFAASLRERSGTASGVRLRKVIVASQMALSLVLVTGAVLFARTLTSLMAKGPGFDSASLVTFGVDARRAGYSTAQSNALIGRIHEVIRASAVAEKSALVRFPLLTGGSWNNQMTIQAARRITTDREVNLNAVTPGFFDTLGVRLVAGRGFDDRDTASVGDAGPRVAIVNETFVRRYFEGSNPLGARICIGSGPDARPDVEIVGVMANISYRGIREESEQAYFPILDGLEPGGVFFVKARGTPEQVAQSIRSIVHDVDPALPIGFLRTVDEQVSRSLNTERMLATLSGGFAALALLLSLVGLYGVMAFVVAQRTREIGIRIALGARRGAALWLVLRDAIVIIAAGAAIALPCLAVLGRLLESQLFGVKATDPITIAETTLVLAVSALAAALVPAYTASTVNPTDALRAD